MIGFPVPDWAILGASLATGGVAALASMMTLDMIVERGLRRSLCERCVTSWRLWVLCLASATISGTSLTRLVHGHHLQEVFAYQFDQLLTQSAMFVLFTILLHATSPTPRWKLVWAAAWYVFSMGAALCLCR